MGEWRTVKKFVFLFAALACLLTISPPALAAYPEITITVNGSRIASDVKPYIDANDRTMVPIRFVAEALGSEVDWNQKTKGVSVKRKENAVYLWAGRQDYTVNGKSKTMDTVPVILPPGRTMVPVRFVAEALGCTVNWDSATRTVMIVLDNGYVLPEETDLQIDMYPPDDNPNQVDISMLILIDRDLTSQLSDLFNIIKSKFGDNAAHEISTYVSSKKNRYDYVSGKNFYYNGQEIWVISRAGDFGIQVTIYLPEA
nr:copper amine oxidase N-terminal domain-containing protein [Phosphitispora fastidiosa]